MPTNEYSHLDMSLDEQARLLFCNFRPLSKPFMTPMLLSELARMQSDLESSFGKCQCPDDVPFSHFVLASQTPGILNLGGDLAHFAKCVRGGDRDAIRRYASLCVDIIYRNTQPLGLPIITAVLVQGDALGGRLETALSFDVIVAERSAKFALPESLFNLFPGMGAYSFLVRKIGPAAAHRLVGGQMHTAEQLHEMGVIDVLAEDGQGEWALQEHVRKNQKSHYGAVAAYRARKRIDPVSHGELQDIVDIWTDAVFRLTDSDLRYMDRLAAAQARRLSRVLPSLSAVDS